MRICYILMSFYKSKRGGLHIAYPTKIGHAFEASIVEVESYPALLFFHIPTICSMALGQTLYNDGLGRQRWLLAFVFPTQMVTPASLSQSSCNSVVPFPDMYLTHPYIWSWCPFVCLVNFQDGCVCSCQILSSGCTVEMMSNELENALGILYSSER
jgi:hypothetical protein